MKFQKFRLGSFQSKLFFFSNNDHGQTAFKTQLTGTGVRHTNDTGIFAQDLGGNLHLVAREGDLLDISDDSVRHDFRRIKDLGFSEKSGFNNAGQLAFWAEFTEGTSGVFVSNLVVVPEPNSLALLAFGRVAMLRQFRRFTTRTATSSTCALPNPDSAIVTDT